jgi:hypothetical protein
MLYLTTTPQERERVLIGDVLLRVVRQVVALEEEVDVGRAESCDLVRVCGRGR